jgi:hypothetical protein
LLSERFSVHCPDFDRISATRGKERAKVFESIYRDYGWEAGSDGTRCAILLAPTRAARH